MIEIASRIEESWEYYRNYYYEKTHKQYKYYKTIYYKLKDMLNNSNGLIHKIEKTIYIRNIGTN